VAGVYLSEAPSPPRFLFGCSSNFVGFESGQIQSVKLLQNMVPISPPSPHPYCSLTQGRGEGGRVNQREGRGAIVHRAGSKILKPAEKSLYR
jgi:hypothetical protein